jgi:hypothetical protein
LTPKDTRDARAIGVEAAWYSFRGQMLGSGLTCGVLFPGSLAGFFAFYGGYVFAFAGATAALSMGWVAWRVGREFERSVGSDQMDSRRLSVKGVLSLADRRFIFMLGIVWILIFGFLEILAFRETDLVQAGEMPLSLLIVTGVAWLTFVIRRRRRTGKKTLRG